MMIPVEGQPHLYRDETTGAIINCDANAYSQYVNSLNYRKSQKSEIENIKKDISEIKDLLKEILNASK